MAHVSFMGGGGVRQRPRWKTGRQAKDRHDRSDRQAGKQTTKHSGMKEYPQWPT